MTRLKQAFVLVMAVCLGLAGCASIQTSGPVTPAKTSDDAVETLSQLGSPPAPGSSPKRLVTDFLRALGAGSYDDFQVARKYLTPTAAKQWQNPTNVTVTQDAIRVTIDESNSSATLSAVERMSIDQSGVASLDNMGASLRMGIGLEKVGSQWRISTPPNGVLMPVDNFENAYVRRNLYFVSEDGETLVPDPRWFPRMGVEDSLVRALVRGPAPALGGVVKNYFSPGIKVTSEKIHRQGAYLRVQFNGMLATLGSRPLGFAYAQLERTLNAISGVNQVSMYAGGHDVGRGRPPAFVLLRKDRMIGFKEGALVDGNDPSVVIATAEELKKLGPVHQGAVGPDGGAFAVVVANGNALVKVGEGVPVTLYEGPNLRSPAVDRAGWAWTGESSSENVVAVNNQGNVAQIGLPWSGKYAVTHLQLSLDGARALVTIRENDTDFTYLCAVIREGGKPVKLANPEQVANSIEKVRSLQFVDDTEFAVLGNAGGKVISELVTQTIGKNPESISTPRPDVVVLRGGIDQAVQLADMAGNIYTRTASTWIRSKARVSEPRYLG
ncbi:MAG: LpqB family beta-propeller domain-containing protein [Actinomycetaceae bacterium]|nr:LpqB family beta-propeller domain-containing protein [Actinomycetaceae bacterium]